MNSKNNKYVGIVSTKTIKDAFWKTFQLFLHPYPMVETTYYFRDARPKSGFIRYKIMHTGFTPNQLRDLQRRLPGVEVKAWKTEKWAYGRGKEVICIYVPIERVEESFYIKNLKMRMITQNNLAISRAGRCF